MNPPPAMAGRMARLLLCLQLAACGGGVSWGLVHGTFIVFGGETRATANATIRLVGSAFVPAGAACTYYPGPFAPPGCSCDIGPNAAGQWTHAATGATGPLQLGVLGNEACAPISVAWTASAIPLAPGTNLISLSMTDGQTVGEASVTVIRQ